MAAARVSANAVDNSALVLLIERLPFAETAIVFSRPCHASGFRPACATFDAYFADLGYDRREVRRPRGHSTARVLQKCEPRSWRRAPGTRSSEEGESPDLDALTGQRVRRR